MTSVSIRSLFQGWPGKDPNPTVRQAAVQSVDVEPVRTPEEDVVHAMLPGDDPSRHPRYTPNPYFSQSYSSLRALVQSRTLPPIEQRLAEEAFSWMRR